jgi:hypothetical protein
VLAIKKVLDSKHSLNYSRGMTKTQTARGYEAVAQRMVNAEERFVEFAIESASLTRSEAVKALTTMRKARVLKIDAVTGQFTFTHGAFAEASILRKAAQ